MDTTATVEAPVAELEASVLPESGVLDDGLVEDVSIDGMCGVY